MFHVQEQACLEYQSIPTFDAIQKLPLGSLNLKPQSRGAVIVLE